MKNLDLEKVNQYRDVLDVLRETLSENDPAEIRLNNHTLRTLAGYTEDSTDKNFNKYVKSYLDKLAYDEHNKKVEKAKKENNQEELQELSNKVMQMAGYVTTQDGNTNVNEYAKSYVDRMFLDRKTDKLFKAMQSENQEKMDEAYREIYSMTSYSDKRPYGVVNEYAQTFVDNKLNEFVKRGIHKPKIEHEGYAL